MAYVIGIAGGTGAGKTTVARALAASVPDEFVTVIEHDGYYRDFVDLPLEERIHQNFDHPDSLETSLLEDHLRRLKSGEPVELPTYDFKEYRRRPETRPTLPTQVVIVEGILVLAYPTLRDLLDLKIFVDTDADVRAFRRISRDMRERGRDFEQIRRQYYDTVRPMHQQFVEPSKRYADVIIPEGGSRTALDVLVTKLRSVIVPDKSR